MSPDSRSSSEEVNTSAVAVPCTTEKVVASAVRSAAVAVIVIDPASWPVISRVATPSSVSAVVRPVTEPSPAFLANVTSRPLSSPTRLPAASRTSTRSLRVSPDARSSSEVNTSWVASAGITVNVVSSSISSPATAVMVTGPVAAPVTSRVATPAAAVAGARPSTDPSPAVWSKLTWVVLSEVTTLPASSRTSTVRSRGVPEARSVVDEVNTRRAASPWTTAKAALSHLTRLLACEWAPRIRVNDWCRFLKARAIQDSSLHGERRRRQSRRRCVRLTKNSTSHCFRHHLQPVPGHRLHLELVHRPLEPHFQRLGAFLERDAG